jgi:amino acid adenylation domain-containing protein
MSSPKLSPTSATLNVREDREYWLKKLDGERGTSALPTRVGLTGATSSARESLTVELPEDVAQAARRLAGGSAFLLYATLAAGVKACLYRYGGGESVAIGSPARRRTDGAFQKANALSIVDSLSAQMSFRQLLHSVRATLLEAYAHQDYAYSRVLRDLSLDEIEGRCPLFAVALSLGDIHDRLPEVKNDLTLNLRTEGEAIKGSALYLPHALTRETVERFCKHFAQVLRHALKQPDMPLAGLSLLDEAECRQLLDEFSRTQPDHALQPTAIELFEQQAATHPTAIALGFGDEVLTYAELNARANRLAHYLRQAGVGAETFVGLYLRRGWESVVGLLAVWKAGGASLPLDPDYPRERIAFMLGDARVPVLLTLGDLAETLPPVDARVIKLDTDHALFSRESEENPRLVPEADTPAYVIYTSGSTGRPKGVVVTHAGFSNLLLAQRRVYEVGAGERVLQFASLSFDASVAEVGLALCTGASLWLASREELMPGVGLIGLLKRNAITNVTLPPSALSVMPEADLPELRTLIVAGEACPAEAVEQWGKNRRFVNAYGPTEATVWATFKECRPAQEGQPTIGRPVVNTEVYILDRQWQPVPVGVAGELYLGGAGLARGYLNRPELTAERFIPHPFTTAAGARLYRTGDVARYRADGEIEFVGRADEQVKVRGFRIELGEVEAALREAAGVRACVVVAREDTPGDKRLVAYVTSGDGRSVETSALRAELRGRVPEYMVPSAFVVLDELPLTPNGKIDRRALPAPDAARPELDEAHVAAGNPVEEVLAGIWADVLGLERIGIHDNFLELGGHSLLATRVFSRVREAFQVEVPIKTLFEAPTVAGLARIISAAMGAASGLHERAIGRTSHEGALPLSFGQQRLWFLHQMEPDSPLYNIPVAVRLTGALDVAAMEASLAEVVRRHEVLRTIFKAVDGRPVAHVTQQAFGALPVIDLSDLSARERESETLRLATLEARRPFDLERGPVMRAALMRLAEEEHVLLVTMHHIASDGWSLGVLIQEVAALYTAYSAGQSSPLAELEVQYADYVRWQREWLQGEVLDAQLDYWKRQLEGAERVLQLPFARVRPATQTHRGETKSLRLSPPLSEGLRALSRREGVTLFMTLLAALQTLFYRYSGQDDITIGSPIANRTRRETENLIGFFVNVLAMRTDLSGNPTFRELLGRVRRTALGAYAHQDLPFEKLVGELQLERTLSHAPLFQAVFVLQNAPMPELELPGLTLGFAVSDRGTTQSDLYLSMTDTEDGLVGGLKYNTDLFDEAAITRLLEHFEELLASVVSDPEARLLNLSLQADAGQPPHAPALAAAQATYRGDQFAF